MNKVKVVCPFCSCGCTFYVLSDQGRYAGIEYATDLKGTVNEGPLCPKANDVSFLTSSNRLTKPLKRTESGTFREISWSEAIREIADRVRETITSYGPDALGFLLSVKMFNEEAYAWQKLIRLLGTNNMDHMCRRMCQFPTLKAGAELMGVGYLTGTFRDVMESEVIVLWGINPAETYPILMGKYILKAKENGAKVIVVDPVKTRTAWHADIYVPVKPGTDLILANSIMNVIVSEGLHNKEFISKFVEGFEDLLTSVREYVPEDISKQCDVPSSLIREIAYTMAKAEKGSILWSAGVVHTWQSTDLCRSLYTLAALLGWYGKEGCCVGGLKGQNNVDGVIDMGIHPALLPGRASVRSEEARKRIARLWGVDDLPSKPGVNIINMFEAIATGKLRLLYAIGANPVLSEACTPYVEKSLKSLDFLVVQDLFLTDTAKLADIVLPAAAWAEKSGSFTSVERRVQWSFKALEPPGEAKSDLEVAVRLAKELGLSDKLPYRDPEDVLMEVNQVVTSYGGVTPERLKGNAPGIFIPCPNPEHPGTRILARERFNTASGRFKAKAPKHKEPPAKPSSDYPYILVTTRVVGAWHTATMTNNSPFLKERWGAPTAVINKRVAELLGISEGSKIKIVTRVGSIEAYAHISAKIREDTISLAWHWGANRVTDRDVYDPDTKVPCVKYVPCKIEPVG